MNSQYSGTMRDDLIARVDSFIAIHGTKVDMREVSPDAPRYTSQADRCDSFSEIRPDCRCILQSGHATKGFLYCQFDMEDKGVKQAQKFLDNTEACIRGWLHPSLFLAGAMTALANKPMTKGDELAWLEICFIQNRLWEATGHCSIESTEGYKCGHESATFCASCGTEICSKHAEKCCMETFCVGCIQFHKCAVLG